jgi:hypothetical protein
MVLCSATFDDEQVVFNFCFCRPASPRLRAEDGARPMKGRIGQSERYVDVDSFRGTAYQRHLYLLVAAPLSNCIAMPMYHATAITVVPFDPS